MFAETHIVPVSPRAGGRHLSVFPDQGVLRRKVTAWQIQHNREGTRVDWHFTDDDARIKLKSLYPSVQHSKTTGNIIQCH